MALDGNTRHCRRPRICGTVAGDSLFTGLAAGMSELLLASPDATTQDCRKLLEAAGL
ncbi:MAG TPA: hypothetical protein VF066_14585 [Thermoleophilaceae bacterium]